jgi:hypothetical protein
MKRVPARHPNLRGVDQQWTQSIRHIDRPGAYQLLKETRLSHEAALRIRLAISQVEQGWNPRPCCWKGSQVGNLRPPTTAGARFRSCLASLKLWRVNNNGYRYG